MNNQNTSNSIYEALPIEQIFPSDSQPRSYFNESAMAKLIASVREYGILQPIIVRPIGNDRYGLVAGERRYKAAKAAGLAEVPVAIREMSDFEVIHCALMENLQREDLNPVEETEGILQLLELNLKVDRESVLSLLNRMANSKRGLTDNAIRTEDLEAIWSVFQSIGRFSPESFRTNRLPLLNLPPDILDAIRQGQIEYTKGKAIAKVRDAQARAIILKEAITSSLSLREIRERIKTQQQITEEDELQTSLKALPKKLKKMKGWNDPDKRQKVKFLLKELEMLLSE